jgi:release factor glutamine methyltransferase
MINVTTIAETVKNAARTLSAHSESPRLDAELLLGKVLGLSRPALIARDNEPVDLGCERDYAELIARRVAGAPVAYLTGRREFWSLPLIVSPAVLVPRPETETLIERALQLLSAEDACAMLDLGTGSGAIALAIASERPQWKITAVDVSPQALEVAKKNSEALHLTDIVWRQGSWFDAVPAQRFNLILANPPYLGSADPALAKLRAEPAIALTAGHSGLDALALIIAQAPQHLHPQGWLVLEHGATQAAAVAELLERAGFTSIRNFLDSSLRPRVTLGTIHPQH